MAEITLTVQQIFDLGLWDKICEYKGWNVWIVNEGQIQMDDIVTFDSEFKKEDDVSKQLAEYIHGKICNLNHEDQCGWYYVKRDYWNSYEKEKYLEKAEKMLDTGASFNQIVNIIKLL